MTFGTEWGFGTDEKGARAVTTLTQLNDNLGAADFVIPPELRKRPMKLASSQSTPTRFSDHRF
jgi:hypothetical protein